MTTPSYVTAVRGLVHFDIGWEKQGTLCRFHFSHSTFNFSTDAPVLVAQSAEPLKHIHFYWPDKPPALQVLLDDLHGDPFLKADFILPLTGVRLCCHIFLLWWKEKGRQSEWNVVIKQSHTEGLNYCYSLYLPRGPYEGKMANVTYLKCSNYFNTNTNILPLSNTVITSPLYWLNLFPSLHVGTHSSFLDPDPVFLSLQREIPLLAAGLQSGPPLRR